MTAAALVAIYFVHLAAAMSPGPAVLLAARTSLKEGMLRGTYLSIGIGLGACMWALAALFGLALLFQVAPALLIALKFVGGAYLLYLAYKLWVHAPEPVEETSDVRTGARGPWGLIALGITTQLANPKPAVFFGTVFLTFLPPNPPVWAYFALMGIIFFNDCGWNILVSRVFSLERTRKIYLNLKTTIDRIFAGLLSALSLKLIST